MGNAFWFNFEPELIISIQNKITPVLQKIFEAITFFGDEYAMILIIGFLFWGYKKDLGKKIAIYAVTALISDVALNNIVKRRRPYFDHKDIKCLKPRSNEGDPYDLLVQGYSFPSGHATNSISTYAALGLNTKKKVLRIVFILIPIIIALSRLALGVHYPTDILAGWLLSFLVIFVISKINNYYKTYILIIVLGIAECFVSRSTDYYSSLGIAFGFIAGFMYEEKFVNFKNTDNILKMIIRTIGGLVLFVVVDTVLKLPFHEAFLASKTMLSFMVRTIRYTIASFVLIGIYPMCFEPISKKFAKNKLNKSNYY